MSFVQIVPSTGLIPGHGHYAVFLAENALSPQETKVRPLIGWAISETMWLDETPRADYRRVSGYVLSDDALRVLAAEEIASFRGYVQAADLNMAKRRGWALVTGNDPYAPASPFTPVPATFEGPPNG